MTADPIIEARNIPGVSDSRPTDRPKYLPSSKSSTEIQNKFTTIFSMNSQMRPDAPDSTEKVVSGGIDQPGLGFARHCGSANATMADAKTMLTVNA
jgi:hypothetical protein